MAVKSREEIIAQLLELAKRGTTKPKMKSSLSISPVVLRQILAEVVDRGFLRFVEPQQIYITTHRGLKFLNRMTQPSSSSSS
jgi:predicted transcriptional regulator